MAEGRGRRWRHRRRAFEQAGRDKHLAEGRAHSRYDDEHLMRGVICARQPTRHLREGLLNGPVSATNRQRFFAGRDQVVEFEFEATNELVRMMLNRRGRQSLQIRSE